MKQKQWTEQAIQEAVATWSRRVGYVFHGDALGLLRGVRGGMRAKAAGARKGWPDLVYIVAGGGIDNDPPAPRIVYIELKKKFGGKLSLDQKSVHREMRALGVGVYVVYAIDGLDAIKQIGEILNHG